jgi:type III secretion protein J
MLRAATPACRGTSLFLALLAAKRPAFSGRHAQMSGGRLQFDRGWLASCLGAFLLIGSGCDSVVRGGLSEAQANQVLVALDQAAISGRKHTEPGAGDPRFRVEVPAAELTAALRVLQEQNLPLPDPPAGDQLLQASGLIATPDEERARLAAATSNELARSLAHLAGVVDARVHLSLPRTLHVLDAQPETARAGILLVRAHGTPAIDEHAVRTLAAAAVNGLSADAIAIVQTEAPPQAPTIAATARIGPFSVRRESAPLLRAVLALALLLDIALAIALIWAVRRKRAAAFGEQARTTHS